MVSASQRKACRIAASLLLLLTLIIAAYTWRFLPDGVGNVFAVVPGIPTILLSRHFFKKAKD